MKTGGRTSSFSSVTLAGLLTGMSLLPPANAAEVWTNAQGNNNWNDPDNWSTNQVPHADWDVIVRGVPQARILPGDSGVANILHVGEGDNGDLAVLGSLTTNGASVGHGSYGIVTIDGGQWTIHDGNNLTLGSLFEGDSGEGHLVLKTGGKISTGGGGAIYMGNYSGTSGGSQGAIHIGALPNEAAAAPGIVDSNIHTWSNNPAALSTVQFNHTGTDYWFTRDGNSTGTAIHIYDNIQVIHTAGVTSFKDENYYKGGTFLNGGTLSVTDNNQLGDITGAVHFNGGIIRIVSNSADFFEDRDITWGENGGGFDLPNVEVLLIKQALSGGTLRKLGEGQVTLAESADLTGVEFGEDSSTASTVLFEKESTIGTVHFSGGRLQTIASLSISTLAGEEGTILSGEPDAVISVGSGNFSGGLTVVKMIKTGEETLTVTNTGHSQHVYNLQVNGGRFHLAGSNDSGIISQFDDVTVNGASSSFDMERAGTTQVKNVFIEDSGTVWVHGSGVKLDSAYEVGNTIEIENGSLTLSNDGELHSSHSDIILGASGALNFGAAFGEEEAAAGVLTVSNDKKVTGDGTVVFNHTGNFSFSIPITENVHIIKAGSGTTSLEGTHNYSGDTQVRGGTLEVAGSLTAGSFYVGYNGSGNFALQSEASIETGQAYFGRFAGDVGTGTLLGEFTAATLGVGYQGEGVLNVANSLTIGDGTGTITLGFLNQSHGTLNLGFGAALNGMVQASAIHGGTGGGLVNFNHTNSYTLNTVLTGNLSLHKENSGTATLTGNNTYTGETVIDEGVLALGNGATLSGTSGIVIASGATFDVKETTFTLSSSQSLSGNGTVEGNMNVAGTVSPGNSVGTIQFNDDLTLDSTAIVVMELADEVTFDLIKGSGGILTYGGTLEIVFLGEYRPSVHDSFHFFTGFGSYEGYFSNIIFSDSGYAGAFDPETGSLLITAVPESSTLLLISGAFLFLLTFRRRGKSK